MKLKYLLLLTFNSNLVCRYIYLHITHTHTRIFSSSLLNYHTLSLSLHTNIFLFNTPLLYSILILPTYYLHTPISLYIFTYYKLINPNTHIFLQSHTPISLLYISHIKTSTHILTLIFS